MLSLRNIEWWIEFAITRFRCWHLQEQNTSSLQNIHRNGKKRYSSLLCFFLSFHQVISSWYLLLHYHYRYLVPLVTKDDVAACVQIQEALELRKKYVISNTDHDNITMQHQFEKESCLNHTDSSSNVINNNNGQNSNNSSAVEACDDSCHSPAKVEDEELLKPSQVPEMFRGRSWSLSFVLYLIPILYSLLYYLARYPK